MKRERREKREEVSNKKSCNHTTERLQGLGDSLLASLWQRIWKAAGNVWFLANPRGEETDPEREGKHKLTNDEDQLLSRP